MKKKHIFLSLFWAGLLSCSYANAQTVNVSQPGTLQDVLLDMTPTSSTLKITGTINGADLKYINNAKGKIAVFTELDLSDIQLTPSPDVYSEAIVAYTGIGNGAIRAEFVLSDSCYVDSSYQNTGLGGAHECYRFHTNDLAGAFALNENYKTITLPAVLKQVGEYAFFKSKVEKVVLPPQAQRICYKAFCEAKARQVELPSALETIESHAFYSSTVDSLHLPATCHELGRSAFAFSAIRRINLENVTELGLSAFQSCRLLTRVNLEKLRRIPYHAFSSCALDSVNFGKDIEHIGTNTFYGNKLKSAMLPEGLKYLGIEAFNNNRDLKNIYIPPTIEFIGKDALPSAWVEKHAELEDGVYYVGKIAYSLSDDSKGAAVLKFREGTIGIVDNIGEDKLTQASLKEIVLPHSLKYIGGMEYGGTFRDCKSLEKVNLPENLELVGAYTFDNCTSLQLNSLPKSLKFIGERAFANTRLYQLHLEDNLRVVVANAFEDCNSLSSLYVDLPYIPIPDPYCSIDEMENGEFGISRTHSLSKFEGLEKVTFSPKVEYVQSGLCRDNALLRRVVFEAGSKPLTIGSYAFYNSKNVTIDRVPERVVAVGNNAFGHVLFKDSVLRTDNIRTIGSEAFYAARGIKTLYIDPTVEDIDYDAFREMDDLRTVYYYGQDSIFTKYPDRPKFTNKNLEKVVIGSQVRLIPDGAFSGCEKLTTLVFEPRERDSELLFDDGSFKDGNLQQLVLPDCRTAFGASVFRNNPLQSLVLGDGTENIGAGAFGACPLKSIELPSTVLAIGSYAFPDDVQRLFYHRNPAPEIDYVMPSYGLPVYVPAGSEASYQEIYQQANVLPLLADSFLLDQTEVQLKSSDELELAALLTVDPDRCCRLRWETSDPAIASVDAEGKVKALSAGKATITASLYYNKDIAVSCEVCVDGATGLGDVVEAGGDLQIQLTPSGFHVVGAGAADRVAVYSLDGALLKCTPAKTVTGLAPGHYLVKVGHKVFKVMI